MGANVALLNSKGPLIILNQSKSIYNCSFKDSHSHLIHTCFPIIASNVDDSMFLLLATAFEYDSVTFDSKLQIDVDVFKKKTC